MGKGRGSIERAEGTRSGGCTRSVGCGRKGETTAGGVLRRGAGKVRGDVLTGLLLGERVEVDALRALGVGDVEEDALYAECACDCAKGGVTSGGCAGCRRTEDLLGADGDERDGEAKDEDDEAERDLFSPGLDHVLVGETAEGGEEKGRSPKGDDARKDAPWVDTGADWRARYPA